MSSVCINVSSTWCVENYLCHTLHRARVKMSNEWAAIPWRRIYCQMPKMHTGISHLYKIRSKYLSRSFKIYVSFNSFHHDILLHVFRRSPFDLVGPMQTNAGWNYTGYLHWNGHVDRIKLINRYVTDAIGNFIRYVRFGFDILYFSIPFDRAMPGAFFVETLYFILFLYFLKICHLQFLHLKNSIVTLSEKLFTRYLFYKAETECEFNKTNWIFDAAVA